MSPSNNEIDLLVLTEKFYGKNGHGCLPAQGSHSAASDQLSRHYLRRISGRTEKIFKLRVLIRYYYVFNLFITVNC